MKYSISMDIQQPCERVVELYDNPDNMASWQPDLIERELLSGESGQPGAVALLRYQFGKRTMELTETIEERSLPERFSGTYEHKGMWNRVCNRFEPLVEGQTRWTLESEFIPTKLLFKLMLKLMPGSFRKQTAVHMERFREFAESS